MKKLLFVFVALLVGGARADNIVTSREYVDAQANTLQTKLPAKNTNTVLLNTDTAGKVGEKAIYDASAAFGAQTDALVTAGQFNTAVQNALESEFVCIERQNGNGGCLLYEIRGTSQKQILPAGYTRLEYIESTGGQYIDTLVISQYGDCVTSDVVVTEKDSAYRALFGAAPSGSNHLFYVSVSTWGDYFANLGIGNKLKLNTKYKISVCPQQNIASILNINGKEISQERIDLVGSRKLYIFARNSYEPKAKLKQYVFQVSRNGSLIFNGIPARRDSDGVLGMYDTVTNTFFTNAGSGTFIAGPVVSSNLYLPSGN